MTTGEIILAIMAALNAAAFMYWMHVDSKLTARSDALSQRLDATWAELIARHDTSSQRSDDLYRELISLRKEMK